MVGYVSFAVANALRNWQPLTTKGLIPVFATDSTGVVVDTPIPAIALHISGEDGYGNTFLGGGIRFYFELQLHCIIPLTNYTFSADNNTQSDMLDISEEIVTCMEHSEDLNDVKVKHDLNLQFDRMETYQTYATNNAISVAVDVHKIVYKGSVEFKPNFSGDKYLYELKRVEIDNNKINKIVIE